jgi:branched-chain amino acid transport system permease protein
MENYLLAIGVSAGIYALMALGLNVIWGMAGLVNLGLVGFFAVGAYVSALLTTSFGMPIWVGVMAGTTAGALTGVAVALITARLRGDYLAIVTLGFAEAIRMVADNEVWMTHGSDGISGIPGPFRSVLNSTQFNMVFLGIVAALVTVVFVLCERLSYSPFGRVLRAIRDDEQVAAVAGKWVIVYKVKAFAIGCAVLGMAGALYAHYTSFIAPDIFVPLLTLYIKLSLLAGGVGNNAGAIVGAVLVVSFLESTRFIIPFVPGISAVQGAALREMLISGFLLVLLRFRSQGLLPEASSHLPRLDGPTPLQEEPTRV